MNPSFKHSITLASIAFALFLCGCGGSKTPPTDLVRSAVAQALPPFLSVKSVTFESIGGGTFNFKAQATCGEALYVEVPTSDTPIRQIKQVNSSGETLAVYGRFAAEKQVDQWRIGGAEVTNGIAALGRPRGDFAGAFVAGSAEAAKAIADYKAEQERLQREAAAKAEKDRLEAAARAEEARKITEAAQKEKEALAEKQAAERRELASQARTTLRVGARFRGSIAYSNGGLVEAVITITENDGSAIEATISSPDGRTTKKLAGVIDSDDANGPIHLHSDYGLMSDPFFPNNTGVNFYAKATPDGFVGRGAGNMSEYRLNFRRVSDGTAPSAGT